MHPQQFRTLADTHTLHEEKVKGEDVLLFIRRRSLINEPVALDADLKGPTLEEIIAATRSLPRMGPPQASLLQPDTTQMITSLSTSQ